MSTKKSISTPRDATPTPSRRNQVVAGLVIMAFAAVLFAFSFEFTGDAAWWPRAMLGLLFALGLVLTVRATRHTAAGDREGDEEGAPLSTVVATAPMLTLIGVAAYVGLLEVIGFFPSTILFLLGFLWFSGVRNVISMLALVLVLNAFIYFLFVAQLDVQLPFGMLFGDR